MLTPDTPAGQALRQHIHEQERHWPKSVRAIEGKRFDERILLEFAAEDMLRDGLITEAELAASGIKVDAELVTDKGQGRAEEAMREIANRLAADGDQVNQEWRAVKSAIADGMAEAAKAASQPGGYYDSSVVQGAIAGARTAAKASVGAAPSSGGAGQAAQQAPAASQAKSAAAPAPKPSGPKP